MKTFLILVQSMEAIVPHAEEGAYTGARKRGKKGKFEMANRGTIFLDEIGEMPLSMQSKVLVFLQEREIERLGGSHPIKVDVRVLAATNRDLKEMVKAGAFRQDLYYRLNVVQFTLPALRYRRTDIPLLISYFIEKLSRRLGFEVNNISSEAIDILMKYDWPGNIRELENVMGSALILANVEKSSRLEKKHFSLSQNIYLENKATTDMKNLKTLVNDYEKRIISQVLEESGDDKIQAARYLGINLSSLYRKIKKYRLD